MKTLGYALLIIASVIMLAGAFFKIMHYAGSAEIMMTAFLAAGAGLLVMFIARKKTKAS